MSLFDNSTVSIVMPAHNSELYISESIDSVISQKYQDWELIVVNDRSEDKTADIVSSYVESDSRIKLIDNQADHGGAAFARNLALRVAVGKYIAFLDSDDRWMPDKIIEQIDMMKSHDISVCHTGYYRFNNDGMVINYVKIKEFVSYKDQLKSNHIPNLTGLYDRSKLGLFEQKNIGHEDYDMWLRIISFSPSVGINKPLAMYRVSANSLSSNKVKSAFWHFKVLFSVKNINPLQRYMYFLCYLFYAFTKRV
ncbi:glycosyltransferase family 2 protein [Vibrio cholerae]|nr:glycosyltransferase family 2 protein [Vibrio cholerae]